MTNTNIVPASSDFSDAHGAVPEQDVLNTFYADIPEFKSTDPATRAKMVELKSTINYYDLNTINKYAAEPTDKLAATSRELLDRANHAGSFLGSFSQFKNKLEKFDFKSVGEVAQKYTATIQRNAARAGMTLMRNPVAVIGGGVAAATLGLASGGVALIALLGAKEAQRAFKRKYREPSADDLRHEIDGSLLQLSEIMSDLEEAQGKIPAIVTDIATLRTSKTTAYSVLGLYIGAARESYRELKEEAIPAKIAEVQKGSLLAKEELSQLRTAQLVLNKKLLSLQTFHGVSLGELSTLGDLTQALALGHVNIENHLTVSNSQWLGTLAQASTAARVSEISEAVDNADKFGDKTFEASVKLSKLSLQMAEKSLGRGGVDPQKLVDFLTGQATNVKNELGRIAAQNTKFEGQQKAIHTATQTLLQAATVANTPIEIRPAAPAALEDKTAEQADLTIKSAVNANAVPVPRSPQ